MTQENNPKKDLDLTPDQKWEDDIAKAKEAEVNKQEKSEPKEDEESTVVIEENKTSKDQPDKENKTSQEPVDMGGKNLDPDKALDAQYVLSMTNVDDEELIKAVNDQLSEKSREERREILNDRDHWISRLLQTDNGPATSSQAKFSTDALGETDDPEGFRISDRDKVSKGKKNYEKELSGKSASLAFTARVKGIKKVYLYNSGFYVCLRPMEISELDEFYMEVDQEGDELGRIVGGLMFLVHDMHLKSKFMELLQTIIIDTNLIDWNKKSVLKDNISIQDLDTLYWAVCSMMHTNGIKLDLICGDPECGHIDHSRLMDINRMRIVDTTSMSSEALKKLISDDPVKASDLKSYREDILDMQDSFTVNQIKYNLNIPTIGEVLSYQKELMADVVKNSNDDYSISNARTMRGIMINYNRNFTPWITRVSRIDDEGNVEFTARDRQAVHTALALNDESEDDGEIMKSVTDYMKRTKLSHVGYAVLSCPACGRSSTDSINGYKAWDAQSLFMSLTYLKLGQIGMV